MTWVSRNSYTWSLSHSKVSEDLYLPWKQTRHSSNSVLTLSSTVVSLWFCSKQIALILTKWPKRAITKSWPFWGQQSACLLTKASSVKISIQCPNVTDSCQSSPLKSPEKPFCCTLPKQVPDSIHMHQDNLCTLCIYRMNLELDAVFPNLLSTLPAPPCLVWTPAIKNSIQSATLSTKDTQLFPTFTYAHSPLPTWKPATSPFIMWLNFITETISFKKKKQKTFSWLYFLNLRTAELLWFILFHDTEYKHIYGCRFTSWLQLNLYAV